jgi:membrane-associated protease RseP (regulator of RpoE activity)
MGRHTRAFASTLLFVWLAACATPQLQTPGPVSEEVAREAALQRKLAFEHARDERLRVLRIAYRLTTAAQDLCGANLTGAAGLFVWSARDYSGDDQKLARSDYDIHDGYSILAVMDDSPAAKAGLQAGDRLVSFDGLPVPEASKSVLQSMRDRIKDAFNKRRALPVEFMRGGARQTANLSLLPACNYQAGIASSDAVNAYADGNEMFVTTGMMNFVKSDHELALVLGHELSHNFLGHLDAQFRNRILGAGAGLLADALVIAATGVNPGLYRAGGNAGAQLFSVAFEEEADYAGLYVMRRAGFDIDGVADFWRRMALDNSRQIATTTDHPPSAERFVALEAAVREIKAKESAEQPLLPNLKKK